jgi:hypothetical protein
LFFHSIPAVRRTFEKASTCFPSGRLRSPGTVFRQLPIGGSRRDLSVEIFETKRRPGLTKAGTNVSASQFRKKSAMQPGTPGRRT